MSVIETAGAAACPVCVVPTEGVERARARASAGDQVLQFHLPAVHCAACISTVERGLIRAPGISDVRVNLTRRRAIVHARPEVTPDAIVAALAGLGYEAQLLDGATLNAGESDRTARDLLMRLGVAGFAMMNIMLLSVAVWSGAEGETRTMFHWISALIALPAAAFSARPFFANAFAALRVRRLNMDVPISLAIALALGMSVYETALGGERAYFDAALSLTFFLLAGRYLDQRMRSVARSAATELAAREVPVALRIGPNGPETVRVSDIDIGDLVMVRPGARIPVDGVVETGESDLDRAFLTGESDPVAIGAGAALSAGEVNLTGALTIRATAVGRDTLLNRLATLVTTAEQARSRYNSLADRAAAIYAPVVHLLALAAMVFWLWWAGDLRFAINVAVAVLIITCPCALGLAVPAVSTVASGRLFRRGLLIKHETALERLAEVTEVVLDKTGTLTTGTPTLRDADLIDPQALALAAALAQGSSHPRSVAIAAAAKARGLDLPATNNLCEKPGHGVSASVAGHDLRLGRADWATGDDAGDTVLAMGGEVIARFTFDDTLRPGAREMVAGLTGAGLRVTLISGDQPTAVQAAARAAGIVHWQAQVMPEGKVAAVQAITAAGGKVLMIGDGLNDTAALASAHVSIAPASALEASRVAADLVLLSPSLTKVAFALRIARSARARILENFAVAAVYNLIAIPLAFFGFASPLAAAIAMSSSSVIVSLNALRVR